MSGQTRVNAALVVLLIGAAVVGVMHDPAPNMPLWITLVLLAFGLINILLIVPGTQALRLTSIIAAIVTLLWPQALMGYMTLYGLLLWPLMVLAAWRTPHNPGPALDTPPPGATRARISTAALIVTIAIGALAYRWIVHHQLEQSAALFVGIPTLLAILVIFLSSPRSAAGVACKAVTIGLLVAMLFLWEGAVCVVMSAPLFYAIAVLIGGTVDFARRRLNKPAQTTLSCLAVLVLVPMGMEGVTDATSFNRDEWVRATRIVHASPADVARAILAPPRFSRPLPLYLSAGFPRATSMRIERTSTQTLFVVSVTGGEMLLNGMEARAGQLVLELEETRPGLMRWRALKDDSHVTHFLQWRDAQVEWEPAGNGATKVTWTLHYSRSLDPAWYFGPWERYAGRLAAGYLIDTVATP